MLVHQDAAGGSIEASEKKQQIVFKIEKCLGGNAQGLDRDPMILVEREARDAAKCRDEWILLPNWFAQAIDFNVARQLRQLLCVSDFALVGIESFQQGGGKAAGGPETGSRRNIRKRRNFYLRRLEMLQCQRFANDGMLDIRDPIHMFQCGIFQIDARAERSRDRDVDILVDRSCDQESFMVAVVRG